LRVGCRLLSSLIQSSASQLSLVHSQTYYNKLDAYQQQQNPKQANSIDDASIPLVYCSQPSAESLHSSHELLLAACRLPPRQGCRLLPVSDIRHVPSMSPSASKASAGAGCKEAELVIPGLGTHAPVIVGPFLTLTLL
jgi:hypothetical protein